MEIYIEDEEILDLTPYMSNDFLKGDKGDKGDTYTINSSDYQAIANVVETDIQSTLYSKVDKVTGKGLSTNDFTDTYKTNVDSNTSARHSHSNKNVLDNISSTDISNWNAKADISDIPDVSNFITKSVDDLVNYYKKSETYTQTEVNNLISAISTMNLQVVQTLPTQDISTTTIYLVPKTTAETNDSYDEYVYVSNNWEHIGSTEVDLTGYATETWVNTQISGKENTSNKVTSLSSSSTDTQYPSAKCVYDIVGNIETILTTLTTGSGV